MTTKPLTNLTIIAILFMATQASVYRVLTKKNEQTNSQTSFQMPIVSLNNQMESNHPQMMNQIKTHVSNQLNTNQMQNGMTLPVVITQDKLRNNKAQKSSQSSSSQTSSHSSSSKASQKQFVPHTHKHGNSSCTSSHSHDHTPVDTYNQVQILNQVEQRSPHVHKHGNSSCTSSHNHDHTPVINHPTLRKDSEPENSLYNVTHSSSIRTNSSSKQFYEQNEINSQKSSTPQIHIHLNMNNRHSRTVNEDSSNNSSSNSNSSSNNESQTMTPLELSKTTPHSETVRSEESRESAAIAKIAGLMISFVAIML